MPTLLNDGYRIHYQVHGPTDGAPVVLVHGYFVDYQLNWVASRWEDELANGGRRVVGLDLRGHGKSDKPHLPSAYDRDVMATDVIRVLDEVGASRAGDRCHRQLPLRRRGKDCGADARRFRALRSRIGSLLSIREPPR